MKDEIRTASFKKLISDLIQAFEAIQNQKPNEVLLSFGPYSRDDIFRTTYYIFKSEITGFNLTKQEFEKLSPGQNIEALKTILAAGPSANMSKLEDMVEAYDEKPIGEASPKKLDIQAAMNTPEARLRRMINSMEVKDAVDTVVPETPMVIKPNQVESLQILIKSDELKKEFDNELPKAISEKSKVTPDRSREIAVFFEKYISEAPVDQEAASIDVKYIESVPADQPIILENVLAKETPETIPEVVGALPLGSMFLRTAVEVSLPTAAKDDPDSTTAKAFYYLHGWTKTTFEAEVHQHKINISDSQLKKFTEYLQKFESAHPDFAAMLAAERAAINPQQIGEIFNGPGSLYQNYVGQMPPVTGVRGFFLRAAQQTFGGAAHNFVERSIRSGIQGAAKKAAGSFIGSALGKIGGLVTKVTGIVTGPLISLGIKALAAFRKNAGKALGLGGVGAVIGGLVGGPAGALLGGLIGAAVSGVDRRQLEKWIRWALAIMALLLASIFSAIAVPLTIAFIVIPISVAIIIFIINSGAYIVPPGTPIGGLSGISGVGQSITSPYIDVIKTATPAGPFDNGNGALKSITYKVIVRAKKGSLKNIKFTNTCQVIAKVGKPTCTAPLPKTEDMPQVIDPGKNYEFSYTMDLSSFSDSFVVDTFNVTADASEKLGAVSATSASVKIGNPPESCPSGWPVDPPIAITQRPQGTYSHSGYEAIDIAKNAGSPVYATHTGVVIALNWGVSYGLHVRINSNCGGKSFQSVYGHLQHILVTTGQVVAAGQMIGTIDSTGNSDGNHLHYEFRPTVGATASNDGPVPLSQEPIRMAPPYIPNL